MTKQPTFKPGDDLSYYLGPDAVRATEAQCEELQRALRDAEREMKDLRGALDNLEREMENEL